MGLVYTGAFPVPLLTFNHTRNLRDRGVKPIEQTCNSAEELRNKISRFSLCSVGSPSQPRP